MLSLLLTECLFWYLSDVDKTSSSHLAAIQYSEVFEVILNCLQYVSFPPLICIFIFYLLYEAITHTTRLRLIVSLFFIILGVGLDCTGTCFKSATRSPAK